MRATYSFDIPDDEHNITRPWWLLDINTTNQSIVDVRITPVSTTENYFRRFDFSALGLDERLRQLRANQESRNQTIGSDRVSAKPPDIQAPERGPILNSSMNSLP
jgi:hypothetical protein